MKVFNKVALIVLLIAGIAGCKEQILHDLTESDSNRLITRLHQAGILAEKTKQNDGGWSIAVAKSDAIEALSALSHARVFRKQRAEVPESSSMLPSRDAQRFQFERAIAGELELTLSALAGVLETRVHLHLPPTDPLFGRELTSEYPSSASVLLITDSEFSTSESGIKGLVAGGSGIAEERISVLVSGPQRKEPIVIAPQVEGVEHSHNNENSDSKIDMAVVPPRSATSFAVEEPIVLEDYQFEKRSSEAAWPLLLLAAFLLLAGGVAIWMTRKVGKGRKRKIVRSPRFESQLEGLSLTDEAA
ncbi:MAG: hypothetical protein KDD70_03915 [Bdellovibrionales bacterium]|nr:hypothetical protein [Bdellovibrionales bacterium]